MYFKNNSYTNQPDSQERKEGISLDLKIRNVFKTDNFLEFVSNLGLLPQILIGQSAWSSG